MPVDAQGESGSHQRGSTSRLNWGSILYRPTSQERRADRLDSFKRPPLNKPCLFLIGKKPGIYSECSVILIVAMYYQLTFQLFLGTHAWEPPCMEWRPPPGERRSTKDTCPFRPKSRFATLHIERAAETLFLARVDKKSRSTSVICPVRRLFSGILPLVLSSRP